MKLLHLNQEYARIEVFIIISMQIKLCWWCVIIQFIIQYQTAIIYYSIKFLSQHLHLNLERFEFSLNQRFTTTLIMLKLDFSKFNNHAMIL